MNEFSELEADLRKLRPAPVSRELRRRIEQALDDANTSPTAGVLPSPRPERASGWWSFALGLTAAAALLVIGLTFLDHPPQTPTIASATPAASTAEDVATPAAVFQPAGLTQVVYSRRDEGLVFLPNESQTPRRRLRFETRETMRWRDARSGASVRVSYPAEQVVLTPASFQ
jgi:uncharacterized protein (DUF2126 family)